MSNEKGSFSAEISQSAIEEALRSVEKRSPPAQSPAEETVSIQSPESEAVAAKAEVSPDSAAPTASDAELESLRAQLELSQTKGREMMEKLKETHERMLRTAADFENYKKRALREREEAQRFGIEKLLKEFLPVMDNLERALEHAGTDADLQALLKGVQMTRKQFEDALGKNGVKGFTAKGQMFDPRLHEAMSQMEADGPPNQIMAEMARGFFLHDRLVRPAMVVVSVPRPAPPAPAALASTPKMELEAAPAQSEPSEAAPQAEPPAGETT